MSILRTSWRSSRVRLPQSFEEFLPGSSSASFVLGCSAEHTSSAGPPSGPSFFVPSSVIQELCTSGSAPASLWQKLSRPLVQSGRLGSQLQAPYETSSVTSSTFFIQLSDPGYTLIPLPPNSRSLVLQWTCLDRLSAGKSLCPPPNLSLTQMLPGLVGVPSSPLFGRRAFGPDRNLVLISTP